jgi:hypothetical protein
MFCVANLERRLIPTNGAVGAMRPVRFDRSRRRTRKLTEGVADSDAGADVVDDGTEQIFIRRSLNLLD